MHLDDSNESNTRWMIVRLVLWSKTKNSLKTIVSTMHIDEVFLQLTIVLLNAQLPQCFGRGLEISWCEDYYCLTHRGEKNMTNINRCERIWKWVSMQGSIQYSTKKILTCFSLLEKKISFFSQKYLKNI